MVIGELPERSYLDTKMTDRRGVLKRGKRGSAGTSPTTKPSVHPTSERVSDQYSLS